MEKTLDHILDLDREYGELCSSAHFRSLLKCVVFHPGVPCIQFIDSIDIHKTLENVTECIALEQDNVHQTLRRALIKWFNKLMYVRIVDSAIDDNEADYSPAMYVWLWENSIRIKQSLGGFHDHGRLQSAIIRSDCAQ